MGGGLTLWLLSECYCCYCCWSLFSVESGSMPAVLRGETKFLVGNFSCDGIRGSLAPVVVIATFLVSLACLSEELRFCRLCSLRPRGHQIARSCDDDGRLALTRPFLYEWLRKGAPFLLTAPCHPGACTERCFLPRLRLTTVSRPSHFHLLLETTLQVTSF
jgi:hypothetical protein